MKKPVDRGQEFTSPRNTSLAFTTREIVSRRGQWERARGAGAFWGGMWGLLLGAAFFVVPGIGLVLTAGPLVAWIVGALEGAVVVGGIGAIGAGLFSIGLRKDSDLRYEVAIKTDRYLLMVHGTAAEAARAHEILKGTNPAELNVHPLQPAARQEAEPVLVSR